jgi:signal transduction histidine kinase
MSFSEELSHELRTPLSRLIAGTEFALRRKRSGADYRAALESVHRDAEQLARTVDILLAASRQKAGIARGTADAYVVATDSVSAFAGLVAERGLDVRVDRPGRPTRVGVQADLAERVLQPVIENACRYAQQRVRVTIAREHGVVVYWVEDDGPGVGDEERERIFEPGKRGHAGERNGVNGAGLSLALARRLARSASGEVEARLDSSGGRFLIRLPAG